ncbi:MAG: response regulator [Desulfobulbaceae bacterium]|nr:response regulator [Desulfobulbaceae bacterium]
MKTKSILLVDDEPTILESLRRELNSSNQGLNVSVVTNIKDAITNINKGYYDLVVTDLMMPDFDGFQVLKAAKQWQNMQTKVIILTSDGDVKFAIDAIRLGVDDYFLKPFDLDDLVYRIRNCLVKQDLERKVLMYEDILPVCSYCKKIRADQPSEIGKGPWLSLEEYFAKVNGIFCSHGCCPECFEKAIPNFDDKKQPASQDVTHSGYKIELLSDNKSSPGG